MTPPTFSCGDTPQAERLDGNESRSRSNLETLSAHQERHQMPVGPAPTGCHGAGTPSVRRVPVFLAGEKFRQTVDFDRCSPFENIFNPIDLLSLLGREFVRDFHSVIILVPVPNPTRNHCTHSPPQQQEIQSTSPDPTVSSPKSQFSTDFLGAHP